MVTLCCSGAGSLAVTFELIQIEKIMASRTVVDLEKDLSKNIFEKTFQVGSSRVTVSILVLVPLQLFNKFWIPVRRRSKDDITDTNGIVKLPERP